MKTLGLAAVVAAVSFLGCSTDVSDLFSDGGDQGGAGGAPSATTGADKSATNGPGPTSNTVGPSTTVGQTTVTNGPSTATSTATATTVVTTGGDLPTTWCNNQECGGGEVCCYLIFEKGQDYCSQPGTCPDPDSGWIELSCNGPSDCPGEQCCGEHNGQNWVEISCHSNCNGGGLIEICEPGNDTCTAGQCNQSQVLGAGYGYCGN